MNEPKQIVTHKLSSGCRSTVLKLYFVMLYILAQMSERIFVNQMAVGRKNTGYNICPVFCGCCLFRQGP